ncbi:hypothetical protein PAXINDRAFT_77388, partial [Paxillus involutus ATCC 200175]
MTISNEDLSEDPNTPTGEIPDLQPKTGEDNIWTRHTDAFNPKHVARNQEMIQIGDDLTAAELTKVRKLIDEFADTFAASVSKVNPVEFKSFELNIPPGMTFPTKVHQRPLTPPQRDFLYERLNKLTKAGILRHIVPEEVKAVGSTVLAQKAH